MKKFLKWCFFGFVGLMLLGMIGREPKNSGSSSSASLTSAAVTAPKVTNLKMSVGQLESRVNENELAIQREINGAGGVLVSGRVDAVEKTFGIPVIHMRGANQFLPVFAHLARADEDKAAVLRKGQSVTLYCETVKRVMGAALYDCQLR